MIGSGPWDSSCGPLDIARLQSIVSGMTLIAIYLTVIGLLAFAGYEYVA